MSSVEDSSIPDNKPAVPRSTKRLLLLTFASTTWRLAIPAISGTVLGVLIDTQLHTKPWATVVGITLGTVVAVMLVYLQIKSVNK